MATLHGHDTRQLILVKGAPERVLEMCDAQYVASTATLDREAVLEESYGLASQGLRVLAMAYKPAPPGKTGVDYHDVEAGLVFVGFQGMIDPPRPEAIVAMDRCKRAGIRVVMITGDHKVTAEAVARRMGILVDSRGKIIAGREMEAMDDEELFERVKHVSVFARVAPEHKLRIVQQLRRHGEVVAVTGDGVNDAPALKQADIGVAMGMVGFVLLAGTLAAFIWQLSSGTGLDHARTVAMTTMVLFQNFHIFNSRSFTRSFLHINPLSNRFLFVSIVAALGLHVLALYWGPLQFVLRTEPVSLETWLVMVLVAATVLLAVEVDKGIRRAKAYLKR